MKLSAAQDEQPAKLSQPLWRNQEYMLLWGGQTISIIGTGITQTAFPLLIWDISHSPVQVGIAGSLGTIPYVLFSLLAGALVDRWDRKRVMILCDIGRGLNMISLLLAMFFGQITIVQIYLNALIEGTFYVFFNIAEVACLPRVVPKEHLSAATAQNEATYATGSMLSPLFGGILYSIRLYLPFLVDIISYSASVISLLFIRVKFQQERVSVRRKLHIEIQEGFAWLWQHRLIRYMAFLTGGFNFTSAGLIPIIIVLVKQQQGTSVLYGLIFTVGGIGGIVGALLGPHIQRRYTFGQVIISTVWIQVVLWPLYAIANSPIMLGLIIAASFTLGPIYNVVQFSYRIALIPDELQGRVNSIFRLIAFGFQPLGWALTGLMLQVIHVVPTILVLALCAFILALTAAFNPDVRNAR